MTTSLRFVTGRLARAARPVQVMLALTACSLAACLTLDGFFFTPRRVERYRWDEVDPELDGELDGDTSPPHPSRVPAAERREGFVESAEGDSIHWVFAHHDAPRATLFYSHGRSKHLGRYWDRVERLWEAGYAVMIYDYPGYGRSTGVPDEASIHAAARAVYETVPTMPDVDPARIVLMGYSLGGAPTFELAVQAEAGVVPRAAGVITEAVFLSTEALVQDGAFLDLPAEFFARNRFDNGARMPRVTRPMLMLHGAADDFVVVRHAELLRARATADVTLNIVPGAGHSNIPVVMGSGYEAAIEAYLARVLP